MPTSSAAEMRTLDPVLTTLAQGYSNSNYIGEILFPIVEISKSKGRIPLFGKTAFLKRNVERAAGSSSNRIPLTDFDLLDFECTEKDIEMAIDYLEEENANDFYKFEQRTIRELSDVLELGRELEAAQLATNPDNYAVGSKLILDETNAFNSPSADPATVIQQSIETLRMKIGVFPNTLIISNSTFKAIINNQIITEKIKYSGAKVLTADILGEIFGIQSVKIGLSVYSQNGIDFEDVWGNNMIFAYVDKNDRNSRSELNPSFGYTLRRKGMPEVDVYYEAGGKVKVVRNTDNYCIKATAPDAAYLIGNTIVDLGEGE